MEGINRGACQEDLMLLEVLNFIEYCRSVKITTGYGETTDRCIERGDIRRRADELYKKLEAVRWAAKAESPPALPDPEKDPIGYALLTLERHGYRTQVTVKIDAPADTLSDLTDAADNVKKSPKNEHTPAEPGVDLDALNELIEAREKCTQGNYKLAEITEADKSYECPMCEGQGEIDGEQFINFDNAPLNILFSGIGEEFRNWEKLFDLIVKFDFKALRRQLRAQGQS